MTLYKLLDTIPLFCSRCLKVCNFYILTRRNKHLVLRCSLCKNFKRGDYIYSEENLIKLKEKSKEVTECKTKN